VDRVVPNLASLGYVVANQEVLPGVGADCPPCSLRTTITKVGVVPSICSWKASPGETTEEFRRDYPIKMICPLGYIYEAVHIIRLRCFGSHSFMVRGVCTVRICRTVSLPPNIGTLWYVPGKYHVFQQFSIVVVD
jgi:hypothetical protein